MLLFFVERTDYLCLSTALAMNTRKTVFLLPRCRRFTLRIVNRECRRSNNNKLVHSPYTAGHHVISRQTENGDDILYTQITLPFQTT